MGTSIKKAPTPSAVATPDFEVKCFLDAGKVLDVEFKPVREVERMLDLKEANRKISMQFVDAKPGKIYAEGWSIRVRKFEKEDKLELSYKHRFPVAAQSIAAALKQAAQEGFHADEGDYDAQVEWGYKKKTLSFTLKKEFKAKDAGRMNLPGLDDVCTAAIEGMPGKLQRRRKEGWARGLLQKGRAYGPVLGKRWTGKWQGPDLDLEVWLIKTESGQGYEPVVELSFKADEEDDAAGHRDKLLAFVREQKLLLPRDVLKTEMILRRY